MNPNQARLPFTGSPAKNNKYNKNRENRRGRGGRRGANKRGRGVPDKGKASSDPPPVLMARPQDRYNKEEEEKEEKPKGRNTNGELP